MKKNNENSRNYIEYNNLLNYLKRKDIQNYKTTKLQFTRTRIINKNI